MSYSVQVGEYSTEIPVWWRNFIESIMPLGTLRESWDVFLDQQLKPYRAIYLSEVVSTPTLIFESERDAMMFILRWS